MRFLRVLLVDEVDGVVHGALAGLDAAADPATDLVVDEGLGLQDDGAAEGAEAVVGRSELVAQCQLLGRDRGAVERPFEFLDVLFRDLRRVVDDREGARQRRCACVGLALLAVGSGGVAAVEELEVGHDTGDEQDCYCAEDLSSMTAHGDSLPSCDDVALRCMDSKKETEGPWMLGIFKHFYGKK